MHCQTANGERLPEPYLDALYEIGMTHGTLRKEEVAKGFLGRYHGRMHVREEVGRGEEEDLGRRRGGSGEDGRHHLRGQHLRELHPPARERWVRPGTVLGVYDSVLDSKETVTPGSTWTTPSSGSW